jgi:hypothetical protein
VLARILLLLCSMALADAPPASSTLLGVPRMPRDVALHLLRDTDRQLVEYANRVGNMDLRVGIGAFESAPDRSSPEAYARSFANLRPHWARLAGVLDREFGIACYLRELVHRDSLSARDGVELLRAHAKLDSLWHVQGLSPRLMTDSLFALRDWCDAHGHRRMAVYVEEGLGDWAIVQGNNPSLIAHTQARLARALRLGDPVSACQALGHLSEPLLDPTAGSLVDPLDAGLRIAREHRLVDQVARFLMFKSSLERERGHLLTAHAYLHEAVDAWRDVEGRGQELRTMLSLARFYARLDCWDAIDDLLDRAGPYLRHLRSEQRLDEERIYVRAVLDYRARSLLTAGDADSALSSLEGFDFREVPGTDRLTWPRYLDVLTLAMVEARRAREAMPLLDAGIAHCESTHAVDEGLPLRLRRAWVLAESGRSQAALYELHELESLASPTALEPADLIGLRALHSTLLARQGRSALASSQLDTAFAILWHTAHRTDPGAEGYLLLADPPGLREAVLAVTHGSAAESYQLELAIRGWVDALGGEVRGEREPRWRCPSASDGPRLEAGETHLLFAFADHALLRWTATRAGIVLDTLPGDRAEWHRRIRKVRDLLALRNPDAALARERLQRLREMSELLPASLRSPGLVRRLYVTTDGPLAAFPFEAIDVGRENTYQPLGLVVDVAAARALQAGSSPGVVVAVLADPTIPPGYLRRYPELVGLSSSRAEADAIRSLWPEARVRVGSEGRKRSVLSDWRSAGLIHVAAHLVRVPEIPYYDFIPLAPDSGAGDADRAVTLEVSDVRSLDLAHCELVVLSTCASGVPYVARRRVGPSMADAFLDAGARAVLRTMRPVTDDEADRFVTAFLTAWRANGHDAVSAARAARIASQRDRTAVVDPYEWSAWSVAVNLVPRGPKSSHALAAAGPPR